MTDTRRRLTACFTAVFSTLGEPDVVRASVGAVQGWDSLATINLITVIEEEFRI
jgi:acyl carrier protein